MSFRDFCLLQVEDTGVVKRLKPKLDLVEDFLTFVKGL